MAAFTRISLSSNRQLPHALFLKTLRSPAPFNRTQHLESAKIFSSLSLVSSCKIPFSFPKIPFFNSSRDTEPADFSILDYLARLFTGAEDASFRWHFASGENVNNLGNAIFGEDSEPEVAAVMLGWLWAEPEDLVRYVELYNAKGVHAVTFVPSVLDVLSLDLGPEEKIGKLADELVSWLSNGEDGGRRRLLMFHTFSFTGWLAYGAILDYWKDRQDLLEKIRGCVVDSGGGDSSIDPKVWAAGLTTAALKESGSTCFEIQNESNTEEEKEPFPMETVFRLALEDLLSHFLNFSDVKRRLTEIVSGLSKKQLHCPQLYLYSIEDKIVPSEAVESFIEDQRKIGKQVFSFNFGSSAHIHHFQSFAGAYASQIHNFLKGCLVMEGTLLKQGC